MAWLAIGVGQTVTLKLAESVMHQRRSHWVDKASHECTGPECVYCKGGAKARVRYFIAVRVGNDDSTWEFPGAVQDQIIAAVGGPDKLSGATLAVTRTGEGLSTRYSFQTVGAESAAGPAAQSVLAGTAVRVTGVAEGIVAALAAFQPVLITEIGNMVWGLLMSAPYLDAVSDGVVMKLKARQGVNPSVLDLVGLAVAESVGQLLVDAGVMEPDGMGGDAEPKGQA